MKKRNKAKIDFVKSGVMLKYNTVNGIPRFRLFKTNHGRIRNIARAYYNMLLAEWRRQKRFREQLKSAVFVDAFMDDIKNM